MKISKTSLLFLWILFISILTLILGSIYISIEGLNDHLGKADVALVLGNKVERDGSPSDRLKARLDKTIELYNSGYFPRTIVSGGFGKEGFDEAAVMRDYLISKGIPALSIITDSNGVDTFNSAKKASEIIKDENLNSILVISQYFHIPRSRLALKRFGISTIYYAHANYFESRDLYSVIREFMGCIKYLFRSYDHA